MKSGRELVWICWIETEFGLRKRQCGRENGGDSGGRAGFFGVTRLFLLRISGGGRGIVVLGRILLGVGGRFGGGRRR